VTASTGRELAAIELALMRCRELAGIRIHQQGKKFPKNIALIANEPYGQVAATLGKGILKEMGFTNSLMLVLGGADNLRSLLQVKGHSQESADAIGEMVEMLAADTLCSCEFPEVPPHVLRYLEEKEAA
jgi:hypothetical protein